jgi:hypothetical protein
LSVLTYTYLYSSSSLPTSHLNHLTPHKLSEGCLEWCSFICVVFGSGLSLGLCWAGVWH